jgi:hypothetical protein
MSRVRWEFRDVDRRIARETSRKLPRNCDSFLDENRGKSFSHAAVTVDSCKTRMGGKTGWSRISQETGRYPPRNAG